MTGFFRFLAGGLGGLGPKWGGVVPSGGPK